MKKITRCDLHVHSYYSFDSTAPMRGYAEAAIKNGIDALCFTDHIEHNDLFDTLKDFDFIGREKEFAELKKEFEGRVKLLIGYEFGEPHLSKKELELIKSYSPDMIIGSVHYPLDHELFGGKCSRREYERLYDKYVLEMVKEGGFDVLGHMDLPKRYHDDYAADIGTQKEILSVCVKQGIVPEINTSTLRKNVSEPMPSFQLIEYYAECGGKYVTVNSDSHSVDTLGDSFYETVKALPKSVKLCYFEKRKLVPVE